MQKTLLLQKYFASQKTLLRKVAGKRHKAFNQCFQKVVLSRHKKVST